MMPTKIQRLAKSLITQWSYGILQSYYDIFNIYDDRYSGVAMLIDIERTFFALCKEYELFTGHPHPCVMVHPAAGPRLDWLAWHALFMQRCALMSDVLLDIEREVQLYLNILRLKVSDAADIVMEFVYPIVDEYYSEYTPTIFWP